MDIASIANSVSNAAAASTANQAATLTLRKALDMQQQTATTLLQALPQPAYSNPSNLGNVIDVKV